MKRPIAVKSRIYVYIILAALLVVECHAQDPQFSQYYANPIYTNPAFAGGSSVGRGVLNYRSQWAGVAGGGYRTFSSSFDQHFDDLNGGLGAIVTNDIAGAGVLQTTAVSLMYSYQIILSKNLTIRTGVQGGFFQKTIDFNKLIFPDQLELRRGYVKATNEPAGASVFRPNFAAGMVIYSPRFYAGIASHNLTEPNQSFFMGSESPIPRRYTAHGGLVIPIIQSRDPKKASYLYPTLLYMQQMPFNQLNLGIYYQKGLWVLGGYFRQNTTNADAFIFLFGVKTQKVRIGLSYDATVSKNRLGASQSFEVSLSFEFKKRTPKKTVRNIRCPEF